MLPPSHVAPAPRAEPPAGPRVGPGSVDRPASGTRSAHEQLKDTFAKRSGCDTAMADQISRLTDAEIAALCAYADGTLPPRRRAEVEARLAASPELLELIQLQRRSLAATGALATEPVPASLTAAVRDARRPAERARRRRRRLGLALAGGGALAAVLVALIVLGVGGAPASPTVGDAARFALRSPAATLPGSATGGRLAVAVQGLAFPDLAKSFGWRATGLRQGRLGGRDATVVYYEKAGRRVAYAIVSGRALAWPATGRTTTVGGVRYQTLSLEGRAVVTWRRLGHTCVMIGDAPSADLLTLASWRGGGTENYEGSAPSLRASLSRALNSLLVTVPSGTPRTPAAS